MEKFRYNGHCKVTGKNHEIEISFEGYKNWKSGTPAEEAFPECTEDDLRFLVNGISPEGHNGEEQEFHPDETRQELESRFYWSPDKSV